MSSREEGSTSCGSRGFNKNIKGAFISISEDGQTASRKNPEGEFDHGLVFSADPLLDNVLFEVTFLSKVPSWSGSLEIGVTSVDPSLLETVPPSSKELPSQTWTLMENSVLQNGKILKENYGSNLESLDEGDTLGVLKASTGELIFFAKGITLGPVPSVKISQEIYAFVNIYGKCASVGLTSKNSQDQRIVLNDLANEATASTSNPLNSLVTNRTIYNTTNIRILANEKHSLHSRITVNNDKIRFHERKGLLIKLSNNNRTCERRRPLEEFNNGVVMTHRPLRDEELFEIRIDRLVDKWSGSIEVGMTAHNPNTLEFPSTMTNQRSGTLMMSGCGILTNGKGTKKGYGHFNLDELKEGDRIGMMRKTGGNLHFYINGQDQGVAAGRVPSPIWGVVDLYGLTVKVTIVDRDERDDRNLITKRGLSDEKSLLDDNNRLMFHKNCGSHAAVINGGTGAHRPNASEEFNFGVVLTNRPLLVNEIFEARLDKMVTKWAGSIEIGVTTHSPSELDFPSTMTNIRSGTWMMTGNGVMHNGTTIIDDYGHNLDKLRVGDRVAVVRKDNGTLHFFVNSEDQGPAAMNVPEQVYGVIDLYGQAAQVSILDVSDTRSLSDGLNTHFKGPRISNEFNGSNNSISLENGNALLLNSPLEQEQNLRFHHLHGRNARISNNGVTASRPNALGEFNDAIVISNRPLKTGEHFEIVIERVVERWSGSIEVGVTLIRPEDLDFPNTMTDINYDTWMLSGSAIMQDGQTVRNGYCCDLDSLSVGSRLGMMRALDGSLRYTINGEDQGVACENIPPNVYAVIDLYGQCAQVSLAHNVNSSLAQFIQPQTTSQPRENSISSSIHMESSHVSLPIVISDDMPSKHKFDPCKVGKSLKLKNNDTTLIRTKGGNVDYVFAAGSQFLESEDIFEVRIDEVDSLWAGSLKIGVTSDVEGLMSSVQNLSHLKGDTIYLDGCQVKRNGSVVKTNYCPSLDRMLFNDKIGVRRTSDGLLKFIINSEESQTSIAASNLPGKIWPVLELSGSTAGVTITSVSSPSNLVSSPPFGHHSSLLPYTSNVLQDSLEISNLELEKISPPPLSFHHDNHGRNIQLSPGDIATRTDSYNQGIVVSNRTLTFDDVFGVHLRKVNMSRWSSSIMIGVLSSSPDKIHFPVSALGLKKNAWVISGDGVFQNGVKVAKIPTNLDDLKAQNSIGVQIFSDYSLHLWINGIDQGPIIQRLPSHNFYYGLLDLYGKCEEVRLLGSKGKEFCEEEETTKEKPESQQHSLEKSITFSDVLSKACEYLNVCKRFKSSLGLPKHFFQSGDSEESGCLHPTCFCTSCCKAHGYDLYLKKGNPPKEYGVPTGWVRFPIRKGCRKECEESSCTRDWHVAYHPTKPAHIRKILDRGNLIPYDDLGLEQRTRKLKSKEDDAGSPQFLFSPTLQYIIHICSSMVYEDKKTRTSYEAKLALQLDVHPGSYKVGPPTAGTLISYDSHFKIDETEWLTKEKGNTTITGILISLET